jgi:asparagine synthase (glutamine-hydrolysing)
MNTNHTKTGATGELFATLAQSETTDAKLLVHGHLEHAKPVEALRAHGVDALHAFSGNFSLVYSGASGLLIARSETSTWPLYYSTDTRSVASNPHRLGTDRDVNDARVAHALIGTTPAQMTFLKGVSRLEPGAWARICTDGITQGRWAPTLGDLVGDDPLLSVEESPKALRRALEAAVGRALAGANHACTANSGGLDSGSLTMLANNIQPTDHITLLFENAQADERIFSSAISEAVPGQNHPVDYPTALSAQDWRGTARPWLGANIDLQATLMARCAALGSDTLILGSGGDFVTSHGYELLTAYAPLRALMEVNRLSARGFGTRFDLLQRWVVRPRMPQWALALNRSRRGDVSRQIPAWIDPDFAREHDLQMRLEHAWAAWSKPTHRTTLNDPFHTKLVDDLVEIGQTFGVHVHLPFFDQAVIRTALRAPPDAHLSDGWTRRLLREAMRGALPESVRTRTTKATFTTLFHAMNRADADAFRRHTTHPLLAQWVDPEKIESLTSRYLAGDDRCWRGPHFATQMGRWLTAKKPK